MITVSKIIRGQIQFLMRLIVKIKISLYIVKQTLDNAPIAQWLERVAVNHKVRWFDPN